MSNKNAESLWSKVFGKPSKVRRRWSRKTLVVGPYQPVDGDSVSAVKTMIAHLRASGKEAFTLPTLKMLPQIAWILTRDDIHPVCLPLCAENLTTGDLQAAFDAMLSHWQPDEIIVVDGQADRLGFNPGDIPVYTIDHHLDHGERNDANAFVKLASSAGCLLIKNFGIMHPVLAVGILTDTLWLSQSMPSEGIECLEILRKHAGLTDDLLTQYQKKMRVPRHPDVLRELRSCELREAGRSALAILKDTRPEIHIAILDEMVGRFDNYCVVRGDGYMSLRTENPQVDVRTVAHKYGGGGHWNMSAIPLPNVDMPLINEIWGVFLSYVEGESNHV